MPEIKNQFTGGKMNKDLDERLVPKGEYRDAMNIQVSTSEGSDVGAVQNILGNRLIKGLSLLGKDATCVGAIADEKNDALYWFVAEYIKNFAGQSINSRNLILQYKEGVVTPVFVDKVTVEINGVSEMFEAGDGATTIMYLDPIDPGLLSLVPGSYIYEFTIGFNFFTGNVVSVNYTTGAVVLDVGFSSYEDEVFNSTMPSAPFYVGISLKPVLGFNKNTIITGINIIDDMLFWTDGVTEPKKINILRSIEGTDDTDGLGASSTRLINEVQGINLASNVLVREEHITVIRKAPLSAPSIKVDTNAAEGIVGGSNVEFSLSLSSNAVGQNITMISAGSYGFEVGDVIRLVEVTEDLPENYDIRVEVIEINALEYLVKILSLSAEADVTNGVWFGELESIGGFLFERKLPRFAYRYKYLDNEYSSFGPFTDVAFFPGEFRYQSIQAYNIGMQNTIRALSVTDFITPEMPRDVKSIDILYKNETSPVIYLLETISNNDESSSGENSWNSIGTHDIPNSRSGSYEVKTESISRALPNDQSLRSWDNVPRRAVAQEISGNRIVYGNYTQGYDIKNNLGQTISPDISMSVVSNVVDTSLNEARKSIKSLRNYEVGVVWGDEYGRETPVVTSRSGSVLVPKNKSKSSNHLKVSLSSSPSWADYYRFYVKETSNEYYNLAVDRMYDAEDGNIWVSFPSVDRNKVDEETYLILKKGADKDELVEPEGRYKIVAIENEAPDYIKTSYDLIVRTNQDESRVKNSCNLWGGSNDTFINGVGQNTGCTIANPSLGNLNPPRVGRKSFSIGHGHWADSYNTASDQRKMGLPDLITQFKEVTSNAETINNEMYVSFTKEIDSGGEATEVTAGDKYRVIDIQPNEDEELPMGGSNNRYIIYLEKPIGLKDEFVVQDSGVAPGYTSLTNDGIHVIFWQKSVANKPEFDGRFFVKILNDSTAKANLSKTTSVLNAWVVAANPSLYKIEDTALNNTNDSTYNFSQDSIAFDDATYVNVDQHDAAFGSLNQESEWYEALKFGLGAAPVSRWFIDSAPFAGLFDDAAATPWLTSFTDSAGVEHFSCDMSSETYATVDFGDTTDNVTYTNEFGTGGGFGRVGMKGIHTTGGSNYIDLSFSQLTPAAYGNQNGAWDIGSPSTNTTMDEHKPVVDRLVINSRFKLTGGEAIFKITGITERRLLNYLGAPSIDINAPLLYSGQDVGNIWVSEQSWEQKSNISQPHNRRFSYRIKYEVDINASPDGTTIASLSDEAGVSNISNTLPGGLQFLTEYNEDEENKISYNPAIFETEPKEDFGLDLYYEASSSLPVFPLTNQNKHLFIPLGTTVVPPYSAGFPSGIFITEWNNLTPGGERIINLSMSISPAEYGVLYGDSGFVQFLRDDGAYVTATLTQPTITESTTQLSITPKNEFGLNWHNCWSFNNGVESNRIGDTFNKPYLSNGVTLSTTAKDSPGQEIRNYGLIYSGIYNSNSSVNNLNQFIAAENITKDINPTYGSIQKLHSGWGQGGDLIALCEDRILKILANKDALFNADGNPQLTSTNSVLGQAIPYSGEYGISKNPESFASEAYRIYFTDKIRGAVMRLSMDGLTPISDHGMKDWFRDNLKLSTKIIGSFDDHNNEYNLTLYKPSLIPVQQQAIGASYNSNKTVTFREDVKGWVSFKSFVPENAISCANEYYSFSNGRLWQHNVEQFNPLGVEFGRNTFYKVPVDSTFNVILNDAPGSVKSFNTINYEGSQSRVDQFLADGEYHNLHTKKGWYVDSIFTNKETGTINEFIEKEGKWFNYIKGQSIQHYKQHILMNPDGSSTFDQASLAIQGIGILDINPQSVPLEGCTDAAASNFQPSAQIDNGSCIPFAFGCTEPTAFNWNPSANTDDGDNCIWVGCTDATAFNYEPFEEIAYSYSPNNSIFDDDSCEDAVYGCTDATAFNYNPLANILATSSSDYSDPCIPFAYGCQIPLSDNYSQLANTDDGTCTWLGCTEPLASNYGWFGSLPGSGFPPGASSYTVSENQYGIQNDAAACEGGGCMDPLNGAYEPAAIYDDGSCVVCDWSSGGGAYGGVPITNVFVADETSQNASNGQIAIKFDPYGPYGGYTFNLEDSGGNTYTTYTNNQTLNGISNVNHVLFSNLPTGTYDVTIQGSGVGSGCYYTDFTHVIGTGSVLNSGCTDVNACNYDAGADTDNGSCDFTSCSGCNDILADTNSQGLQTGTSNACITPNTFTPGPCTISCGDSLGLPFGNYCCSYTVYGCTDPLACNYMQPPTTGGSNGAGGNTTVVPDGSCSYNGCMDASVGIFPSILGLDQAGNACSYPCQDNSGNDIGFAANNYAPCATIQTPPNVCDYGDLGCMDSIACNFDPNAQVDDGSCVFGFAGATIGDPNTFDSSGNQVTTPVYYHTPPLTSSATVQHYVASYPVSSPHENDIGLTIQSVQQNLSQYVGANDKVTVKLWRKQQPPTCGSLGCAWVLQHTHDIDINQVFWEFGASATDGAVFGGNRTSPGNNPYPWGASSTSGTNFAFQPLYYSTVEYAVEITSTISSVTYGESTVIDPSAQTEACGVWKPFTFNPQPSCANPYAVSGCTNPSACNFDASATCEDGSCYYGSATLYYANMGCSVGPSCDPGNLGTSYISQAACWAANPNTGS